MSKIRVIICRVDEEDEDQMTELGSYELPEMALSEMKGETTLDKLEQSTHEKGNEILKGIVQAQWSRIDEELASEYRQRFSPSGSNE